MCERECERERVCLCERESERGRTQPARTLPTSAPGEAELDGRSVREKVCERERVCVRECVCVRERACVCVYVCARERVCERGH